MSEFNVRLASKGEIRGISDWFLEERSKYPGMSQLVGRGVRGWMVRHVVTPRYLRKAAYTYVLEQDGKTGGFATRLPMLSASLRAGMTTAIKRGLSDGMVYAIILKTNGLGRRPARAPFESEEEATDD